MWISNFPNFFRPDANCGLNPLLCPFLKAETPEGFIFISDLPTMKPAGIDTVTMILIPPGSKRDKDK